MSRKARLGERDAPAICLTPQKRVQIKKIRSEKVTHGVIELKPFGEAFRAQDMGARHFQRAFCRLRRLKFSVMEGFFADMTYFRVLRQSFPFDGG